MKLKDVISEAVKTDCQTCGVVYNTTIKPKEITVKLELPKKLNITDKESKKLSGNLHNALELVLAKYFYTEPN